MNNLNFIIDEEKCIGCGLCAKDCLMGCITINDNKKSQMTSPDGCIKCQHCLAICPVGAVSILDKKPENSDKIYAQNPDMILNLIKSRRSNRLYKNENVSKEDMDKLKEMLAFVPTGCNFKGLHFSFIEDTEVMQEFREHVNSKIVSALTKKPIKAVAEKFAMFKKFFLEGDDVIFRGAPHMIVVSNSIKSPCVKEDPIIALSYFELYAQSLGLGTCWCGLAEYALMLFPELSEYLEIPDGYQPSYVMLFGPKQVNYQRTTQPNFASISVATKKGFEKLGAKDTIKRYFWNLIR